MSSLRRVNGLGEEHRLALVKYLFCNEILFGLDEGRGSRSEGKRIASGVSRRTRTHTNKMLEWRISWIPTPKILWFLSCFFPSRHLIPVIVSIDGQRSTYRPEKPRVTRPGKVFDSFGIAPPGWVRWNVEIGRLVGDSTASTPLLSPEVNRNISFPFPR